MYYDDKEKTSNAVASVNMLHEYLNKLTPIMIKHFIDHPPKFNEGGALNKRHFDAAKAVLDSVPRPVNVRIYFKFNSFSFVPNYVNLDADITYNTSDSTVEYIKRVVVVYDEKGEVLHFSLPIFDVATVMETRELIHKKQKELQEIKSEIYILESSISF